MTQCLASIIGQYHFAYSHYMLNFITIVLQINTVQFCKKIDIISHKLRKDTNVFRICIFCIHTNHFTNSQHTSSLFFSICILNFTMYIWWIHPRKIKCFFFFNSFVLSLEIMWGWIAKEQILQLLQLENINCFHLLWLYTEWASNLKIFIIWKLCLKLI
jgi:hypothetical protein